MNIQEYKNVLLSMPIDYYINKLQTAIGIILDAISDVIEQRNMPRFVFFFDYPPDDIINTYYNPSQFNGKWIAEERPIICIVRNSADTAFTDKESLVSYDINATFSFDFIYPHYNVNEEENSYSKFNEFLCIFSDMFEKSGRSWSLDGVRLFVDRTAFSIVSNDYAIFAEILCHFARCEVTFTIWKPSEMGELQL